MVISFYIFQICIIVFLGILISSLIKNPVIKLFVSSIFSLFITAQISSLYFGARLIDYKYYVHFNFDDIVAIYKHYILQLSLLIAVLLALTFLMFYLSKKLIQVKFIERYFIRVSIALLSIFLLSVKGWAFNEIFQIIKITNTATKQFSGSLKSLGIDEQDYISPSEVMAEKGKNIIIISVESLEKGFLEEGFATVTPNLRELSKEMVFYNMSPAPGSDWTSGSLYTYLTGVPAFFKKPGNEIFQNSVSAKITGMPHVLKKAGYNPVYLIGKAEFSGINDILNTYGVTVKSEETIKTKYPDTQWGLHDKDLFAEAKKEILLNKNSGKPFALFMSTVNSHAPDGVYDERMEQYVSGQRNGLEFSIASVDYLIGDFISFLKKENILQNTVIYIFPDHLLMQLSSETVDDFKNERSLYLMTNADIKNLTYNNNEDIYQIDLPKIILEGAGINHNAKFLTDFIKTDKIEFLKNNISNILALNESSLETKNEGDAYYENYISKETTNSNNDGVEVILYEKRDTIYLESSTDKEITLKIGNKTFNSKEGLNLIFKIDNKFFHIETFNFTNDTSTFNSFIDKLRFLDIKKQFYAIALQGTTSVGLSWQKAMLKQYGLSKLAGLNSGESYIAFSNRGYPREIVSNENLNISMPNEVTVVVRSMPDIKSDARDTNKFIAHAGGKIQSHTYTNSKEALDLSYKKGFRLFELDIIKTSDNVYVAAHDWNHWKMITGFEGDGPVSSDEFLKHKIFQKFTPMDIGSINKWFNGHPDAILVTDKVNEPNDFADKFTDKNRLIMELFTMDALIEGLNSGIKSAMASQSIIAQLKGNKVDELLKLGVKDIAVSRRMIKDNIPFFKDLQKNKINTYVFHVNFDTGKDEVYVLTNEMHLVYGLYADEWGFR